MKEKFKLFYTQKQVRGMVDKYEKKINELQEKINRKEYVCLKDYIKFRDKSEKLEETNKTHQITNGLLRKENESLKQKVKELQGSKGGYIAKINQLIKSVEEAQDRIKDLQSNRYLIKEVPKDRTRNKQVMQIKSGTKNSKIIKEVKSE